MSLSLCRIDAGELKKHCGSETKPCQSVCRTIEMRIASRGRQNAVLHAVLMVDC